MKKNKKIIIIITLIVVVIIGIVGFIFIKNGKSNKIDNRKMEQVNETSSKTTTPITQTIQNTITTTGQIESEQDEKITLHTSYYFSELLVDENVYISEGTNILSYTNGTYLQAPYDCVLVSSNLPAEEAVCTNNNYIEIKSIASLCMELEIDESEINKVSVGNEATIEITSTKENITGYVTKISEVGNYSTSGSTFTAVVSFENTGSLKLGMSATCNLILEEAENVLTIPVEALQTDDDTNYYVTVVGSDGKTEKQNVEIGVKNDAYVEIKSGISSTDKIQLQESSTKDSQNSFKDFNKNGMERPDMSDKKGMQAPNDNKQ